MLNRNAEALFWVGRYMERAENHARLIDVHYHIQHERDFANTEHKWARLIDALGAREEYMQQFEQFNERDVLSFITLDRGFANSLFSCVLQARGNLRTLREKLPSELWDILNGFYLWLGEKQVGDVLGESPNVFFRQVKERAAMFQGAEHSVMQRETEWNLIESGRYLERAENTVRIIQSILGAISEDRATPYSYLLAVLKSVGGYQAFRKYYADGLAVGPILEFLMTGTTFPRSVLFAFTQLEEHLEGVRGTGAPAMLQDKVIRLAGKVRADLSCLERDELSLEAADVLLLKLKGACQSLGKMMADTLFRLEEASA
jgi:uncharacterized alpha-E superfamily protein